MSLIIIIIIIKIIIIIFISSKILSSVATDGKDGNGLPLVPFSVLRLYVDEIVESLLCLYNKPLFCVRACACALAPFGELSQRRLATSVVRIYVMAFRLLLIAD